MESSPTVCSQETNSHFDVLGGGGSVGLADVLSEKIFFPTFAHFFEPIRIRIEMKSALQKGLCLLLGATLLFACTGAPGPTPTPPTPKEKEQPTPTPPEKEKEPETPTPTPPAPPKENDKEPEAPAPTPPAPPKEKEPEQPAPVPTPPCEKSTNILGKWRVAKVSKDYAKGKWEQKDKSEQSIYVFEKNGTFSFSLSINGATYANISGTYAFDTKTLTITPKGQGGGIAGSYEVMTCSADGNEYTLKKADGKGFVLVRVP